MTAIPLPEKSVRLSSGGFKELYENYRRDPDAVKLIADHIEANPRAILEHSFDLTETQKRAIKNTSDDELRERARVLIAELRAGAKRPVHFEPDAVGKGGGIEHMEGCGCAFRIDPNTGSTPSS